MNFPLDRRTLLAGALGATASLALPAIAGPRSGRRFFERIGRPIGLQLYALGDEPQKDLEGTLKRVAAIGYRDIEMPGLLGKEAGEIRRAADAAGVAISSVHTGTAGNFSIRSDTQRIVDVLGTLGARQAVVPMFPMPAGLKLQPGEDFAAAITRAVTQSGEDMWKQLAELLNERAAALKPHGIAVGYHNHSVEFMQVGSRTGWEILAGATDPGLVHFEADIGWIVSAGVDPLAFLKRYKGRVRQVHVKDVQRGFRPSTAMKTAPTEVGSGSVAWARVLPAAYAAGVRHFYVEQEPPFAMPRMDSAARSYSFLAQLRA